MSEKVRVCVILKGRVQGVFFRQETLKKAREIGVFGFVRNLAGGEVEALFEGEKEKAKEILSWIKEGPRFAKVKDCQITWQEYKGEFNSFEIKY